MKNVDNYGVLKKRLANLYDTYGFAFTVIILAIYKYQYKPVRYSLGFKAEMWAEGATNYFDCVDQVKDFISCLMKTDAGYLAFLPRIYSQIISIFNSSYGSIIVYQQILGITTVIFCSASVTSKVFEKLYGQFPLRLILALILSTHFDYELHTFINASYYLIIPASSLLVLHVIQKELKLSLSLIAGSVISLTILSKGIFVCLLPMTLFVILTMAIRRLWKNICILAIPTFAAGLLQIHTMFQSYTQSRIFNGNQGAPVLNLLWTSFSTFLDGFISIFYPTSAILKNGYIVAFVLLLVLIWIWKFFQILKIFIKSPRSDNIQVHINFVALLLFGGALSAHIISVSATATVVSWMENPRFPFSGRQWFVQAIILLLVSWHLLQRLNFHRKKAQYSILISTVFMILRFGSPFKWDRNKTVEDYWDGVSFSNWKEFAKHFEPKTKCAPINPYPWFYGQNCEPAGILPPFEVFQSNLRTTNELVFSVSELSTKEKMLLVGFFIKNNDPKEQFYLELIENDLTVGKIQSVRRNNGPFVFFALPQGIIFSAQKMLIRSKENLPFKVALTDGHTPESAALWFKSK